ncbi:MAG: LysM peptidoglycan-binding domain-containing protein [Blastochloris sp.]|nr:LysM peptidoglycan-binding domain-containing protein [Blastochloris sp.]
MARLRRSPRPRGLVLLLLLGWISTLSAQETHTLAKGDTFYSLSRKYGVTLAALQKANPDVEPARLRIGQKIVIPSPTTPLPTVEKENTVESPPENKVPDKTEGGSENPPSAPAPPLTTTPEFHQVVKGETLTRIALLYGLSVAQLKELNQLKKDDLQIGQKLRLRRAGPEAPSNPPLKTPTPPVPTPTPPPAPRYLFVSKVKTQIDKVPSTQRKWKYVIIHHSGTKTGNAGIFEYYHRRVRGMENGLAYHLSSATDRIPGMAKSK